MEQENEDGHLFPQLPPCQSTTGTSMLCPLQEAPAPDGGPLHVLVPTSFPCPAIVGPWLLHHPHWLSTPGPHLCKESQYKTLFSHPAGAAMTSAGT